MSKSTSRPPLAITTGDHRGIGPEVIAKALHKLRTKVRPSDFVIFGEASLYKPFRKLLPKKWRSWREAEAATPAWNARESGALHFIEADVTQIEPERRAAYACGRYIELAAQGTLSHRYRAIVTGPIDKNELHRGGYPFDGHTEMLQSICGSPSVTMMLAGPKMRVSLATIHVALKNVSEALTIDRLMICFRNTAEGLRRNFGIQHPRLAVLGLNPHSGDGGLFGTEESEKITPAIEAFRKLEPKTHLEGPFPPDGFFAQWRPRHERSFDAVICMYHDQGLIPVKLFDFENTVNVSLGLPIVRTSVDHGIGLDIAGKNRADPQSFRAALELALRITKRRRN